MAAFGSGKPVMVTIETPDGTIIEAEALVAEISYATDTMFSDYSVFGGPAKRGGTVVDLSFKVVGDLSHFLSDEYATRVRKERAQDQWACDYCKHVNPDDARYCGHKDVDRLRGCGANKPWRLL